MADKVYTLNLSSGNVQHVRISRSKDGYNYASMFCKMSDKESIMIDCEWQGDSIPDFAMNVMEHMGGGSRETSSVEVKNQIKRIAENFTEWSKKVNGEGDANIGE